MSKKIITFVFLSMILIGFSNFTSYADDEDEYIVSFKYYPQYNTTVGGAYTGLGYYTHEGLPYDSNDWQNLHTYTIGSPVAIYSIIDRYDDFAFSIEGRVENNNTGNVNTFKLINMNIYYDLYPKHVLTEGELKGTLTTYIDDSYFQKGYTAAYLQGKNRLTGEWVVIKTFQVHKGEVFNWYWKATESNPSWNYTAYRINFSLWNWNYDGLSLVANGQSSGVNKLVSCDFVGVETNEWEKAVEQMIEMQSQTINEIRGLGDLIKALPKAILDGLYDLIVPDDLTGKFNGYIDRLLDGLGILGFPFEFVRYELEQIASYSPTSSVKIPDIKFMNQTFLEDYTFDFNTVGNIKLSILNIKLIDVIRMITAYLFALSFIGRVNVLLYDFGILKSPDDDIGGSA